MYSTQPDLSDGKSIKPRLFNTPGGQAIAGMPETSPISSGSLDRQKFSPRHQVVCSAVNQEETILSMEVGIVSPWHVDFTDALGIATIHPVECSDEP